MTWDRSVVEPSLTPTSVLDATTVGGTRGDITGAGGEAIVTDRPVVEVGVDRSQASQAEAVAAAERVAAATGIDVAPYVKQVRAAGDAAFVQAITYRADDVPPAVDARSTARPGCCSSTASCRWRRPASSRRRSSARSATSPRR